MSEHDSTDDGEELTDSDLDTLQTIVADANKHMAAAMSQAAGHAETRHYAMAAKNAHRELVDAYAAVRRATSRAEVQLDRADYGPATPRRIKKEHAERLKETYDGPVLNLALMLLERNREHWLWRRPETNGADAVERHGLTENQRSWLNELQDAWEAYDGGEPADG